MIALVSAGWTPVKQISRVGFSLVAIVAGIR